MKGTARVFLELRIGKRVNIYRLMPLNPDPSVATKAWRLFKSASKFYDVAINSKGWITCTCADATFREHRCKHCDALAALGLLPKEKP